MFTFLKRPLYILSNKLHRNINETMGKIPLVSKPEYKMKEKWIADFSKPEKSPFIIKSESSYNANILNGSLVLDLKKPNCIAWVDTSGEGYQDLIIESKFRLDSQDGYAAAGLLFRITDEDSYYLALVSSKGYFRLDSVKINSPRTLLAWTEISGFDGVNISLNIISYANHLIFIVNGRWLAEINDDSPASGRMGFALVSYEQAAGTAPAGSETPETMSAADQVPDNTCVCRAWLDHFSVDYRLKYIERYYNKWNDSAEISAESRLRFAETLAVMGNYSQALEQIIKAWRRREEAVRSVTATYTETRTRKELLFAARLSFWLEQYSEAEDYIDACLEQGYDNAEGKEALTEKVKILAELDKFSELKQFVLKNFKLINKTSDIYALLGKSYQLHNEYKEAATAWARAFKLEKENGIYAVNAANALELSGNKDKALEFFLEAGRLFLRQDNYAELSALVPRLVVLGELNYEARELAGKWAFSIEDYVRSESEFAVAERIRRKINPRPDADPAVYYLRGLIYSINSKYKEAVRFLEVAVRLVPSYGLFRFKLAENRFYLNMGVCDPQIIKELRSSLELIDDPGGNMANHAGTLMLNAGDYKNAGYFFNKALLAEPDNVEYISNRYSCYMKMGQVNEAEELLLEAKKRSAGKTSAELTELIMRKNMNPGKSDLGRGNIG